MSSVYLFEGKRQVVKVQNETLAQPMNWSYQGLCPYCCLVLQLILWHFLSENQVQIPLWDSHVMFLFHWLGKFSFLIYLGFYWTYYVPGCCATLGVQQWTRQSPHSFCIEKRAQKQTFLICNLVIISKEDIVPWDTSCLASLIQLPPSWHCPRSPPSWFFWEKSRLPKRH